MDLSRQREQRQVLLSGNYLSFATRKRCGEFVETPVWFAPLEDYFVVFSAGQAGKVKRLRNFAESRIAPCTLTGKVKGSWLETEAFVIDNQSEQQQALNALRQKYGWLMWAGDLVSA